MRITLISFVIALVSVSNVAAQSIDSLTGGTKTSLRGLSVVDDDIVWVSGSNGMVGKSINGGKTWQWLQLKGYEKREFRDVEAFDSLNAIIMAVGEPGLILKTDDGGIKWKAVYTDTTKGVFMDAMDFISDSLGVLVGDPINGKMYMLLTSNGGNSWQDLETVTPLKKPMLANGEAFFASSGTNVKLLYNPLAKRYDFLYVTGGKKSRFFVDGLEHEIPIVQGLESTGANSLDVTPNYEGVIVGGDFNAKESSNQNCILFNMKKGFQYSLPQTPPKGYKSCVIYLNKKILVTCGTSGVDYSKDGGKNWKQISTAPYHVVQKAKYGNAVFLAGGNGRVARFWAKG